MGLREVAEQDLSSILENKECGYGWDITLIAPNNCEALLTGFTHDISQVIDPDTGQAVSGRLASIVLRNGLIYENFPGLGLPKGISETTSKPWVVRFDDINGNSWLFKVVESNPDRTLGLVKCFLELYTM